ncbi:hypothetical protein LBMAG53_09270 [Planctomycetota bacterium]|nr:hypothetical protein LBMAG53_09270 [Planctomycetota bacterium]
MDTFQRYEFDRQGYLVLRNLIPADLVSRLSATVERIEESASALAPDDRPHRSLWGSTYHHDRRQGVLIHGQRKQGGTFLIEDFWNADPVFDQLIDFPATMDIVRAVVRDRVTINNSEIRIRYQGNYTGAHMGGPIGKKYQYRTDVDGIDCTMVRMVYFLQHVKAEDGAFSVVPGTHKSAFPPPTAKLPEDEPGAIPLEVGPGDAIFFTEHLRHGGFTNRGNQTRRTLHVGYGPCWMRSQNIATMDEMPYLTPATWERLTPARRELFLAGPIENQGSRLPHGSRAALLSAG